MRRLVAALVMTVAAVSLAACTAAPTTTGTSTSTTPAAAAPVVASPVAAPSGDTLSPKQSATPVMQFPTDPTIVPKAVLSKLSAKQPMMVYFYDPSERAASETRVEIDTVAKKYRGMISLVTFNFTAGVPETSSQATIPPEIAKAELMTAALNVKTTPYVLFVDRYGRITYRFAGYVDRGLLEREALRATQ
jgi:hypothetical protein